MSAARSDRRPPATFRAELKRRTSKTRNASSSNSTPRAACSIRPRPLSRSCWPSPLADGGLCCPRGRERDERGHVSSPWRQTLPRWRRHTTIGAAHPVQMGAAELATRSLTTTMKSKIGELRDQLHRDDSGQARNRNIEWARSSVKESASITAEKALELKVVEIIAKDQSDLLGQVDGREVNGRKR